MNSSAPPRPANTPTSARAVVYDHALDYRRGDWVAEVLDLTHGQGVHLVLDPIGGAHWKKSLNCLASTGRLVMYGFSTAAGGGRLAALKEVLRVP